MTVIVTGASGHVGANLVRALLDEGRHVRVLVHKDRRGIEGLDVEEVQGSVLDIESLERAFQDVEVVYHMAVYITLQMDEWPMCKAINLDGTRNVVNACLKTGVQRLIHSSSINALSQEPERTLIDESRSLVNSAQYPPYDRSKAAAENRGYSRNRQSRSDCDGWHPVFVRRQSDDPGRDRFWCDCRIGQCRGT